MKRILIVSYTEAGGQLNRRLAHCLDEAGDVAVSRRFGEDFRSTEELLRAEWRRVSALIFVGAVGIAVRHVAPFLEDKLRDPAVLVTDERSRFVIPILSGHVGGGVALARVTADMLGAQPVITTATDVREHFAVDVFARENHLLLPDPSAIKRISSAVLRGDKIEMRSGIPIKGTAPAGVTVCEDTSATESEGTFDAGSDCDGMSEDVRIRYADQSEIYRMPLCPYIVGIGCKKGRSGEKLFKMLTQACDRYGIGLSVIAAVASIDLKKQETGIWELSRRLNVPYEVFSAEELKQVKGSMNASDFVDRTVGVDNVCERSALCLAKRWSEEGGDRAGAYELIVEKQVQDGMTMAIAKFHPAFYRWRSECELAGL